MIKLGPGCYQLVQSIVKVSCLLAERVGQREVGGCHSLGGSTWWLLHLAVEKPRVFDDCYHRVCIKCPHFGKISRGYMDWTILGMQNSPKSPPGISLPVNVPVHKQENNQLLSIDQVHKLVASRDRYSPIYICSKSDQCK